MKVLTFPLASDDLPWTGERFLVGRTGEIEFEHYHRYLFAAQFCDGRDVLDIASGEGYGGLLLSQVARRVTGVDIDVASVEHASRLYGSDTLTFIEGSCAKIPVSDNSFDVVVSFETIEHIRDQQDFLSEVRRVLRSEGLLVVSTPDRDIYTNPAEPNPFHLLELSKSEFVQLLSRHFSSINVGLQKATSGSIILPSNSVATETEVFLRTGTNTFEANRTLDRAPFLIAIASNSALPPIHWGILDDPLYLSALHEQCAADQRARQEVEQRLVGAVADHRSQVKLYDERLAEAAAKVKLYDERLTEATANHRSQVKLYDERLAEVAANHRSEVKLYDERLAEAAANHRSEVELYDERLVEAAANHRSEVKLYDERLAEAAANHRSEVKLYDERLAEAAANRRCQVGIRDQRLAIAAVERQRLERQLDAVELRLGAIETSTSWRLMAKVHKVAGKLGLVKSNRKHG